MPGSNPPIVLAQEVRASPPNPSMVNDKLVKPRPVRGANPRPPNVVNRGTFQRVPVQAILQGGGMNGLGAPPIVLAQPVQGANPSANAAAPKILVNRRPVRGANPNPPRVVNRGTFQRAPVASILQGGGMNGLAGLAAAPSVSGGGLESVNKDMSVSAQQRAKKAIEGSAAPIVGDYTDAIRQAAGFAFGPKRMPGQGFAASGYSYPSQQMVVGATLAGVPIIAPPPMPPRPNMAAPKLTSRAGIRGQISSSPSEERRQLLSTLMGLGAIDYSGIDHVRIGRNEVEGGSKCNSEQGCRDVKIARVRIALRNAGKPETDEAINYYGATKWGSVDTLTGLIRDTWDSRFMQNQKLDDVHYAGAFRQWMSDFLISKADEAQAAAKRLADEAAARAAREAEAKARQGIQGGGRGAPATGGGGGGGGVIGPILRQYQPPTATYTPPVQPAKKNTALIVGAAVAGVAVLGGIAYFAMKKQ